MSAFSKLFRHKTCNILGMIHVPALPGSPASSAGMAEILERVEHEAEVYRGAGVGGVVLENMHDTPYCRAPDIQPQVAACMAVLAARVRALLPPAMPVGVQVLAAANREALAVAVAAGLQFVRVEGFVFGHVADEGWVDACAGPLLRYRRAIGGDHVAVLCDIKKKHSAHAVTADVDIVDTAKAARFFRCDGVIVTGGGTGEAASPSEVAAVVGGVGGEGGAGGVAVLVGSGVTAANLAHYSGAQGLIIGSEFKQGGDWRGDIDPARVAAVVEAARRCRS